MNILKKLTYQDLKKNRKRSVITIIAIVLSVALITAVASMASSFRQSYLNRTITYSGNFHYSFSGVPGTDLSTFENNRSLEKIYKLHSIGYSPLQKGGNDYKKYFYLIGGTQEDFINTTYQINEGRYPQKDGEIAISKDLTSKGEQIYQIGDVITLDVSKWLDEEGKEFANVYYDNSTGTLVHEFTKEYTVVGLSEKNSYEGYQTPAYTCLVYDDPAVPGTYTVYARYTKQALANQYKVTANILGVDEDKFDLLMKQKVGSEANAAEIYEEIGNTKKYDYTVNSDLISLETLQKGDSTNSLYLFAAIVIVVIMTASVFCIKTSFDIAATENIRHYGVLRSVGATKKQIKASVRYQGLMLSAIGIPLGICLGLAFTLVLVRILQGLMQGIFRIKMEFYVTPISIVASILFGLITVMISASRSARKASKIAPIIAIRGNDDVKINRKSLQTPRIIRKLLGVSGVVAYKNTKRDKKKYRTTVVSIVVSCITFISMSYVFNTVLRTTNDIYVTKSYNLIAFPSTTDNVSLKNNVNDIISVLGEKDRYCILNRSMIYVPDLKITDDYNKLIKAGHSTSDNMLSLVCLDDDTYQKYLSELGINESDMKDGGVLLNSFKSKVEGKVIETQRTTYTAGDVINGKTAETDSDDLGKHYLENFSQNISLTLAAVTSIEPECYFSSDGYPDSCSLIVSRSYMDQIKNIENASSIYISAEDPDTVMKNLENLDQGQLNISNIAESKKQNDSLIMMFSVFAYGFIIIVTMIGITSIINTVTSNMNLRQKEFASLKSIGMTRHEFNQMVSLESFLYGTRALLIGVPIGILITAVIYYVMRKVFTVGYLFPWKPVLFCIVAVSLLLISIMRLSISKINQQNTIETIRSENI
jgi:putative ABC transport system permease protein